MQLGKTIVKIRKEYEFTQEDFARKFNVTRQTVSNWENEKSYPDLITLIKISDEFGYSLDAMLKENPDMTDNMNLDIKIGKLISKIYEKGFIIFIIGVISCLSSFVLSLVDYNGVVEPIVWLIAVFINLNVVITSVRIRKIKKTKRNRV